jgi:hypothetical protein
LRRLLKSRHKIEGLPEERKALAERYTITAAEAERREVVAAEVPAGGLGDGSRRGMAEGFKPAVSPRAGEPRSPAGDLGRSEHPKRLSTLREHVGQVLSAAGMRPTDPHDTKTMQYFLSVYRTRNTGD